MHGCAGVTKGRPKIKAAAISAAAFGVIIVCTVILVTGVLRHIGVGISFALGNGPYPFRTAAGQ
jgi:hypothetical protein